MSRRSFNGTEAPFVESALTLPGRFQSQQDFLSWFQSCEDAHPLRVTQIPFRDLRLWKFDEHSGDLRHDSGRFFRIEGIRARTNFGNVATWEQPIINQPEIGILGIIVKYFEGIPYFLMQSKMEPGNPRLNQLSPTVQATKSNYTRVHSGKVPHYLEYFTEPGRRRVICDQLQSEQGSRFLRKRNRNMIVEVTDEVPLLPGFCWLTLGEIKALTKLDNFVNMEARTVISCAPLLDDGFRSPVADLHLRSERRDILESVTPSSFGKALVASMFAHEEQSLHSLDELISWVTEMKCSYDLLAEYVPLNMLRDWEKTEDRIRHVSGKYFSVIAVSAESGNREVSGWTQPLIEDSEPGLIGFLCQRIDGVLHFLVCGKVEVGNFDTVELGPTVSCSQISRREQTGTLPLFAEEFLLADPSQIHVSAYQSEEGGRFYHFQSRYMVVEIDELRKLTLPSNYRWMTFAQVLSLMRYNNVFNIEARGVLACLRFVE